MSGLQVFVIRVETSVEIPFKDSFRSFSVSWPYQKFQSFLPLLMDDSICLDLRKGRIYLRDGNCLLKAVGILASIVVFSMLILLQFALLGLPDLCCEIFPWVRMVEMHDPLCFSMRPETVPFLTVGI